MKIELNIFTNSTVNSPSTKILEETYASFNDIFKKELPVIVWCDVNPNVEKSEEYFDNLKTIFPTVYKTTSLVDGYVRAIKDSNADYLFMLEHDWKFLKSITNSLEEIINDMERFSLWYLLFNKFNNFDTTPHGPGDQFVQGKYITFYHWNRISNNPHIINRSKYKDSALQYIKYNRGRALGIEQELTASPLLGAIYGSKETRATVYHLDGRKIRE